MAMVSVSMEIPQEAAAFWNICDKETQLQRNALVMYPFIKNNIFSHGRIAEMLGISKLKLISIYENFGIPYINMSWEEVESDAENALKVMQMEKK